MGRLYFNERMLRDVGLDAPMISTLRKLTEFVETQEALEAAEAEITTQGDAIDAANTAIDALEARNINTTAPLEGGGDLSADRTLSLADTAVTPASYTNTDLTVDAKGRITAAANGTVPSGTVTSVGLSAPTGFSVGGSPVTSSGTLAIAFDTGYSLPTDASQTNWDTAFGWGDHASAGYVSTSRTLTAGSGLTGGGDLSADRTFTVGAGTGVTVNANDVAIADTAVTPASYGSATSVPSFTVDQQGRLTAASGNTIPTLDSGTFTPTGTGITNIDSVTPEVCQFMRVGDVVTVSGLVAVDATATGDFTFDLSVPVSSYFEDATQCCGTGAISSDDGYARISGMDDQARVEGAIATASSANMAFSLTYLVQFSPSLLFTSGEAGAWYDPSDLSTVWQDAGTTPGAADSVIGRLDDKSGNGNHLAQASASLKPILREAGGVYTFETDGTDDQLIAPLGANLKPNTYFALAVSRGTTTSAWTMARIAAASGANDYVDFVAQTSERLQVTTRALSEPIDIISTTVSATGTFPNAPKIIEAIVRDDTGNNECWIDGVLVGSVASNWPAALELGAASLRLPHSASLADGTHFGPSIIIDRIPSAEERANILTWLASKQGRSL